MRAPAQGGVKLARWIRELERSGRLYVFYKTEDWKRLRAKVMMDAHNECCDCMERGKYSRAVLVHHDQEIRHRPDLALSYYYRGRDGQLKRNLYPLCTACHERRHDRAWSGQGKAPEGEQLNEERW